MRDFELRDDFHFDLGQSKVVFNGFFLENLRKKNQKVVEKNYIFENPFVHLLTPRRVKFAHKDFEN